VVALSTVSLAAAGAGIGLLALIDAMPLPAPVTAGYDRRVVRGSPLARQDAPREYR